MQLPAPEPGSPLSLVRTALVTTVSATLAYSWAPFDFGFERPVFGRLETALQPLRTVAQFFDLVPHILIFILLALLLVSSRRRKSFWKAMALLALFAMVIEVGQLFVPSRHPQAFDFLAHLFGACLGSVAGGRLVSRFPLGVRATSGAFGPWSLLVPAIAWVALSLLTLAATFSLQTWDPTFPLLVGNEDGGGRPWHGEIRQLNLFRRALNRQEVSLCFARSQLGDKQIPSPPSLLAAFDFASSKGPRIVPEPPIVEPLVIGGSKGSSQTERGLSIAVGTHVSTNGAASGLTSALAQTGAFTVEVYFVPDNLTQSGPARIVSLSSGPWKRNFTLGQEAAALVFRVRNGVSGPNGTRFQMEVRGELVERPEHVVVAYDRGVCALFVDGKLVQVRDFREPSLVMGLGDRPSGELPVLFFWVLPLVVAGECWLGSSGRFKRIVIVLALVLLLALFSRFQADPINAQATRELRFAWTLLAFGFSLLLLPWLSGRRPSRPVLREVR